MSKVMRVVSGGAGDRMGLLKPGPGVIFTLQLPLHTEDQPGVGYTKAITRSGCSELERTAFRNHLK